MNLRCYYLVLLIHHFGCQCPYSWSGCLRCRSPYSSSIILRNPFTINAQLGLLPFSDTPQRVFTETVKSSLIATIQPCTSLVHYSCPNGTGSTRTDWPGALYSRFSLFLNKCGNPRNAISFDCQLITALDRYPRFLTESLEVNTCDVPFK